jgi:hypothetical protein
MPETSALATGKELREATLRYLWCQWKAVGATVQSNNTAQIVVDPEALILMSLWMLEHERRLTDVVWSWVNLNSALLSIQRLSNLRKDFPPEVSRRLSALAEYRVMEARDPRWKSLKTSKSVELGERTSKLRAVEPRFDSWATLMLQVRLGLGVGVKADVLTIVLGTNAFGTEWLSVAAIADTLGYTTAAVRRAADDLARARFIKPLDTPESDQAAQRMFTAQVAPWASLLGQSGSPRWGYWPERYQFVIDALTWLERAASQPTLGYASDVEAREILQRHGVALRKDRIIDSQEFAVADLNLDYLVVASKAFVTWLGNHG